MVGRARFRTLAVVVAAAATALTAPAAANATHARFVPHAGPGSWVQLSSGTISNIVDPSVHRFGSSLQVVWAQETSPSQQQLKSRILAANGSASGLIDVLPPWASLDLYPAILASGGQRLIVFGGLQDVDSSNPYSQGYNYYATSPDGISWTLANGTVSSSKAAGSYGNDAVDAAGTVIAAFTDGTANQPSYHVGLDSLPPANADGSATPDAKCCAYDVGAGYDLQSGQTWVTWYSISGEAATEGINAQQVAPSLGTRVHAPQSSTYSNGAYSSGQPDSQRVQVANRSLGGLYTAYGIGYPTQTKVALWRLGSSSPLVANEKRSISFPGVAAAPGGRLWLFWWDSGTSTLRAVRTNPAATRFGRVCSVRTPHSTTEVWKTAGDGSRGLLDLVVNAGTGNGEQIYSTQVRPCLSAGVSPGAIRSTKGGSVTVTVTDAGSGVAGASVKYGRTVKKTNSHGRVTFKVAKGTKKGRKTISVGRGGYTGLAVAFRVR